MSLTVEENIKAQLEVRKNAHIMLVDGMSKLKTHKVKEVQSSVFNVSGLKWKLIVYPAGEDGTKEYLSFYLKIKDKKSLGPNWEVKCSFKLTIVPQNGFNRCQSSEWLTESYNANQRIIGEDSFISYEELKKKYLVNDKVVFCADITDVRPNFPVTNTIPRTIGTAERITLTEVSKKDSRFTWKITQFSSFDVGDYHFSNEFKLGQRRWKLKMFPKGCGTGKGSYLSLFLTVGDFVTADPMAKTLAVYKLRLLDQFKRNHYETSIHT
ncbi:hypothetical protein EUTSA_v10016948mg [Eutrema salsugineum]|uniref:MATH domain-containing protein n=1 Tax=Eutrema salsugineum TaxID=72664 RepID=V4MH29_EUTSA|nr:hypothetical protein EUTSA_v10016948mg [Eutrema salsugineum]